MAQLGWKMGILEGWSPNSKVFERRLSVGLEFRASCKAEVSERHHKEPSKAWHQRAKATTKQNKRRLKAILKPACPTESPSLLPAKV